MTTLTDSNISIRDRIDYISNRLILMSLNIHIELNDGRFSFSRLNEIRKHSDISLVSSSFSNTLIDELLVCIEYYCHQVNELTDLLHLIIKSLLSNTNFNQIIDDLSKGSQLCLDVIKNYHLERIQAVQSMLSSPFREDAWYLVHEIDSNIFGKCRIILIRLRMYFLLMHQILTNDINLQIKPKIQSSSLHSLINNNNKKRYESNLSISNNFKRRKILDFKV
ncbi:unnamed protein product [Rotaria sp. Silwood2]|nr:unnamed protein product [Rotaria sp. Silwood2]CAF3886976.1 unnamed protein product [Rotaria sp. Silwood2]CAF4151000.1 unnamed protein product [Rotaria sp. Silwood2]